jgi:hypothetical protein
LKLKGGAVKRARATIITDFSAKPDDAVPIRAALTFQFPNFDGFIAALTDAGLKEFRTYLIKQKNSDRVLEWILSNIDAFKAIQDIKSNFILKYRLKLIKTQCVLNPLFMRTGRRTLPSGSMKGH